MASIKATPWRVVQANVGLNVQYKPVYVVDANGRVVIRVGQGDKDLRLAHRIAAIPALASAVTNGMEAAQRVVDCWEKGDLAGAVNALEAWIDEGSAAIASMTVARS